MFDAIRDYMFSSIPFLRHGSVEIGEIGPGTASATLPDKDELKNHIGTAHAAALFLAGETASGAALASTLGPLLPKSRPVAASASIQYVALAKGAIQAHAKVERPAGELVRELTDVGKVRFDVLVSLVDEGGTEVAKMTVDWHVKLNK